MLINRFYFVILLMMAIIITGCNSNSEEPSTEDIQNNFSLKLPAYWEVTSLNIEVSENVGTKVEPVIQSRFIADIELTTNTYKYAEKLEDATIISQIANEGLEKKVYGISTSRKKAGSWKINFKFENNPITNLGKPKDFFEGNKVIVEGSSEEEALKEAIAKRKSEEERLRREKEEKRRAEKERIANRRKEILQNVVSGNKVLHGTVRNRSGSYPVILKFLEFDANSGKFLGHTEYPQFDAIVKLEGKIQDRTLTAKEKSFIKTSDSYNLGDVWTLQMVNDNKLEGDYRTPKGSKGSIKLVIK